MNWKNEVKAWLLMSTGLGTILLLMGSTFYVVITQSFGLFNMTGESEFSLAFWANTVQAGARSSNQGWSQPSIWISSPIQALR